MRYMAEVLFDPLDIYIFVQDCIRFFYTSGKEYASTLGFCRHLYDLFQKHTIQLTVNTVRAVIDSCTFTHKFDDISVTNRAFPSRFRE